jgi:1,4-alpha-glucan branching enzyme
MRELNRLYAERPALYERDFDPQGFQWIDGSDAEHSVLAFMRRGTSTRLRRSPASSTGRRSCERATTSVCPTEDRGVCLIPTTRGGEDRAPARRG